MAVPKKVLVDPIKFLLDPSTAAFLDPIYTLNTHEVLLYNYPDRVELLRMTRATGSALLTFNIEFSNASPEDNVHGILILSEEFNDNFELLRQLLDNRHEVDKVGYMP